MRIFFFFFLPRVRHECYEEGFCHLYHQNLFQEKCSLLQAEESITKVLSGNDLSQPEISFKLNGSNDSMLEQMQQSIENGTEYYICGRPETIDGKITYPINEGGK